MSEIEYNYRTIEEVTNSIKLYANFGITESIILCILAIFTICLILYVLPFLKALKIEKNITQEKKKKKLALKQILIQKEVEEEIENELKLEAQQKMGK